MIGKLALLAALAGSAAGAAVVLADEPAPAPAAVAAPAVTPAPGGLTEIRDARLLRSVPDPTGGPPWVLRHVAARAGTIEVECVQLGRLDGDRFGWVGADGTFRPNEQGFEVSASCGPAGRSRELGARVMRLTTVTAAADGTLKPRLTVTWGETEPTARAVLPDGEPPIAIEDGLLLDVRPEARGPRPITGVIEAQDGRRTPFNRAAPFRPHGAPAPVEGTEYVAAQAADPGGGEPWAIIGARSTRGKLCLGAPGRLVGDRLGRVFRDLGVALPDPFGALDACIGTGRAPTRGYPMRITTGIWGSGYADDQRARIERRVESTRIVFSGRVHPDVVSVTIRTPRDVRTLVPSSKAHAILAVYDGRFPGGRATATARMKDGREVTRSLYVE